MKKNPPPQKKMKSFCFKSSCSKSFVTAFESCFACLLNSWVFFFVFFPRHIVHNGTIMIIKMILLILLIWNQKCCLVNLQSSQCMVQTEWACSREVWDFTALNYMMKMMMMMRKKDALFFPLSYGQPVYYVSSTRIF